MTRVELSEQVQQQRFDLLPKSFVKGWAKPVRAWACTHVHGEQSFGDFLLREQRR